MSNPDASCPTCSAAAGEPCVDEAGKPIAGIHTPRVVAGFRAAFGSAVAVSGPALVPTGKERS
jgi:hypothetical protein